jgi:hypothetical protein
MTNYVLAFRGRADRTPAKGEDEAWGAWFGSLGSAVVDFGHRVQHVQALSAEGEIAGEAAQVLTGYVVIAAESQEAAAKLASGCPGLRSGVSVEIAETVDA